MIIVLFSIKNDILAINTNYYNIVNIKEWHGVDIWITEFLL